MDGQVVEMLRERLDSIDGNLIEHRKSIDHNLEILNNRTSKLENWQSALKGGFAVLTSMLLWVLRGKG